MEINNNELTTDREPWVLFMGSDTMGKGEQELGEILVKSYLYTLTETKPYPESILLVNSAVKLATENQEAIEYFKMLEKQGTEIISCGTCLDYYNCKNDLKVGQAGNMYMIVEKMNNSKKIIKL